MFPNFEDENLDEKTREWLKKMPNNKVFEWLGNDSDNVPNYLHLLNLYWKEDVDKELKLFREVARKLSSEPEYLRQMICTSFWRHTLVACVSVILLEAKEYCNDLKDGFDQRNFVSPQIAVALGLLCPKDAVEYLSEVICQATAIPNAENYHRDASIHNDSKRIVAAQVVLSELKPNLARKLAKSKIFQQHQKSQDGEIGATVAKHHWDFWLETIKKQNSKSYWNQQNKSFYQKLRELI
jgi:hypothetical protein